MRLSPPTAVAAVVALMIGLLVSHGPWWAQAADAQPQAQVAAAPQPAAAKIEQAPTQPAAPAPAPAPAQPAAAPVPKAGGYLVVYLRADAVGSLVTGANAELRHLCSRRGTFVRSDDNWFILKNETQEIWVPRSSIALVEMGS
jgi:hypothetical protein